MTPYGDRLEPKTKDYVPDVVIQTVLELNEILLPTNDNDNDGAAAAQRRIEARSLARPFRSLSTGPGGAAKVVTQLDEDGNRGMMMRNKAHLHFSVLADLESCSSSSSSVEFS